MNDSYTHDLPKLVEIAALDQQLLAAEDFSDDFRVNWAMVKDWSEDSRYEERSETEARSIIKGIDAKPNGVLEWIMQQW